MADRFRWILGLTSAGLLAVGVASIAAAVANGSAQFYLVFLVPVITGHSVAFAAGAGAVFLGVFLGSWAAVMGGGSYLSSPPPDLGSGPAEEPSGGGLVLVGPIPILFGRWRTHPPVPYWALFLFGAAFFFVAFLLFFWVF